MTKLLGRLLTFVTVWRLARRRGTDQLSAGDQTQEATAPHEDPSERHLPQDPRAERLVAGLLLAAAVFGFGFTAVYILDGLNDQLLGVAIGGMFALLAAAAIIAGKNVVPQETSVEQRTRLLEEDAPEELLEIVKVGGEGVSRRVLLGGAAGIAGIAVTTAVVATRTSST